ncbi:MAG: carboxylate-amine ligase [Cryomorphaceae bacterium]|nr:carboxylate-amine ligase [Flavobacteriales bacterium]
MYTIGIEEEYQVINPETRELISHEQKLVSRGEALLPDRIKAELHESQIEVDTSICRDVSEAEDQIKSLRTTICEMAGELGLAIGAAGTHPFSSWQTQLITPGDRYNAIVTELQDAARSNLIFGLHVHVGIPNRSTALKLANSMRYFLPHLYALSTNSPFFEGRNTGFKSFRSRVFDKFPRTGIPDHFDSLGEYDAFIDLLVRTNCIDNAKNIWWDIRVHPVYPTVEVRICDVTLTANETIGITALVQAIAAKLCKLQDANLSFNSYKRTLLSENKWRAGRYGIQGKLIDFGKESEVDCVDLINELLNFVDDVAVELNSRKQLGYVEDILAEGTGADRQLAVFERENDLKAVVDFIIAQTKKEL